MKLALSLTALVASATASNLVDHDDAINSLFAEEVDCATAAFYGFCAFDVIYYMCPVSCAATLGEISKYQPGHYCQNQDAISCGQYGGSCNPYDSISCFDVTGYTYYDSGGVPIEQDIEAGYETNVDVCQPATAVLCPVHCSVVMDSIPDHCNTGGGGGGGGSSAHKDPHFTLAHGDKMDLRGTDGGVFNLLSAKDFSFNVKTAFADFKWTERHLVHGSKLAAAYWTVRTPTGVVNVNLTAPVEHKDGKAAWHVATVSVNGAAPRVVNPMAPFELDDLRVVRKDRMLTVSTAKWETTATTTPFPFSSLNKAQVLLDVEVKPLYDVDSDKVAPHGLFGQAYDGDDLAVDGARDHTLSAGETTTKAQGEGAIEGVFTDYLMASAFATDFKFSRFDKEAAPRRDVSQLTGTKRKKSGSHAGASSATDFEQIVEAAAPKPRGRKLAAPEAPKFRKTAGTFSLADKKTTTTTTK